MPSAVERKELQQFPIVKEVSLLCQVDWFCVDGGVRLWVERWRGCKFFSLVKELNWVFLCYHAGRGSSLVEIFVNLV